MPIRAYNRQTIVYRRESKTTPPVPHPFQSTVLAVGSVLLLALLLSI